MRTNNQTRTQPASKSPNPDQRTALITITAGSGGTEAQDWAQMLLAMYLAWASQNGLHSEILDTAHGRTAGFRTATISVTGSDTRHHMKVVKKFARPPSPSQTPASARRGP